MQQQPPPPQPGYPPPQVPPQQAAGYPSPQQQQPPQQNQQQQQPQMYSYAPQPSYSAPQQGYPSYNTQPAYGHAQNPPQYGGMYAQQQPFVQQQQAYGQQAYASQPQQQTYAPQQPQQQTYAAQQPQQQTYVPQQQPQQQVAQPTQATRTSASHSHSHQQPRSRLMRPPFVDPVTNILYDTDNPEYEGWLTKQSTWLKEWRRRYFILKGSKLFFARNEYSAPHGMIDLAQCTTVKSADLKSKKRHSLEIFAPETCYLLYADTESEKDDWIGRVGKAIVRCSRTYYSAGGSGQASRNAQEEQEEDDDDDIYTNDDPGIAYFND